MAAHHAVQRTLARCGLALTDDQANELWLECKTLVPRTTAAEVEACDDSGGLDTLEREDLLDAIARTLTGSDWPMNATPAPQRTAFSDAFSVACRFRGYEEVSQEDGHNGGPRASRQGQAH